MLSSRPDLVSRSSGSSQKSQKFFRHAFNPLDDPRPVPFKFPKTHHLVITTAQGVYTCGTHGITEIFRSGSKGIVAAKRASNGSGTLAVADDQLVILHDVRKGMQKSYRLRSADGRVRMLRYAKASNRLFFTTTLQDAVQSYDLEHSRLLDPAYEHPTPPNVFAISSTSHLLLSASDSPPVIQLTNLLLGTRPLLLRPQCSAAAVVVVEFHSERGNIFFLGFADGTCAAYDAAYIFRGGGKGERKSGASASRAGWEVSHIRNLHAAGNVPTATGNANDAEVQTLDTPGYAFVGAHNLGIIAAAFVPGHKATAITVGSDGRCCLIDFVPSEARQAILVRSWHIAGPATCLCILAPGPEEGSSLPIAGYRDHGPLNRMVYVAIGCRDSKVVILDLEGNLFWEHTLFQGGAGIIDLEWMEGDDWPQPMHSPPPQGSQQRTKPIGSTKSPGAILAGRRPIAQEVVAIADEAGVGKESQRAKKENQAHDVGADTATQRSSALNHVDLPSLMKSPYPSGINYEDTSGIADTTSSESLGSMMKKFEFPIPPTRSVPRIQPLQKKGLGPLPRNNSWATVSGPHNDALQDVLNVKSIEAYVGASEATGKSALANGHNRPWSPPKGVPPVQLSQGRDSTSVGRVTPQDEPATQQQIGASTERATTDPEDIWMDIAVDDDPAQTEQHSQGSSSKEKQPSNEYSSTSNASAGGASNAKFPKKHAKSKGAPREAFTIFMDDKARTDHPQPLSAHPSKTPLSGRQALAPTDANTSHTSPVARAPWYRQRAKNGSLENHRSSIYGPGALARKVQQEVMITVNVELDVLRREMDQRFKVQKKWFEFEIKKSQVWALTVEDENRKLREELAKERKRREAERGGGGRINLC